MFDDDDDDWDLLENIGLIYTDDPDLAFMERASNEDLGILVDYLLFDNKGKKAFNLLTIEDDFKKHYPHHHKYWGLVAAQIQFLGYDNIGTYHGVKYREIVTNICNKLEIDYKRTDSIDLLEDKISRSVLSQLVEEMNEEQIKSISYDLDILSDIKGPATTALIQSVILNGGFTPYKLTVIVANGIAKSLLGKGLSFATNTALTKGLSLFVGPLGWTLTALWAIFSLNKPNYSRLIPIVIQIAYMRQNDSE